MEPFEHTELWKQTLAEQPGNDSFAEQRARLRTAFMQMRVNTWPLHQNIALTLPKFTKHDLSHSDALWRLASLLCTEEEPETRSSGKNSRAKNGFFLTPTEGFVLGAAFLVHDLGLGLASYSGGIADLQRLAYWKDVVMSRHKAHLGRLPTEDERRNPDPVVVEETTEIVLRELHARHAEKLAQASWKDESGIERHLIDDEQLREAFGPVIGKVAHSHWWNVADLETEIVPNIMGVSFIMPPLGKWILSWWRACSGWPTIAI